MQALPFAQVEHLYRVVAQRADKQALAGTIERDVIDAAFDSR